MERAKKEHGGPFEIYLASKVFGCSFIIHSIDMRWQDVQKTKINGTINHVIYVHEEVELMN